MRPRNGFQPNAVATAFLALFLCGYLLYQSLGVFIGTFRFDEVYFLHISWSDFHGYPYEYWGPRLIVDLLKTFWILGRGDVSLAWVLRFALTSLAAVQAAIVFKMTVFVLPADMRGKWRIQSVAACAFLVIMGSFRGYEVRPEVLSNTVLLLAAWELFRLADSKRMGKGEELLILLAGLGLVIGATVSSRHVLPSAVFFVVLLIQAGGKKDARPLVLWGILAVCAAVAGYLNLVVYNYFAVLKSASAFQSARDSLPWLARLRIGGGLSHLIAKVGLLLLMPFLALSAVDRSGFKGLLEWRIGPAGASTLGLCAYYLFLFTVDVQPFEYVRSIEWVLILIALAGLFRALRAESGRQANRFAGAAAVLIALGVVGAVRDLGHRRNVGDAWKGLLRSSSSHKLASMSDSDLVRMMSNDSILDQMRSRAEYCSRHPDGVAIVHDMADHPVAMRDGGSSILGGWRHDTVDVGDLDVGEAQYVAWPKVGNGAMREADGRHELIGNVWIRKDPESVAKP